LLLKVNVTTERTFKHKGVKGCGLYIFVHGNWWWKNHQRFGFGFAKRWAPPQSSYYTVSEVVEEYG